eukprot:Skav200253  [mRNA]  locus=scaffold128:40372:40884:+ [translate_table: standard]
MHTPALRVFAPDGEPAAKTAAKTGGMADATLKMTPKYKAGSKQPVKPPKTAPAQQPAPAAAVSAPSLPAMLACGVWPPGFIPPAPPPGPPPMASQPAPPASAKPPPAKEPNWGSTGQGHKDGPAQGRREDRNWASLKDELRLEKEKTTMLERQVLYNIDQKNLSEQHAAE